ncbi:malate synthase [Methylohalomonas lacus]|uniref:Malate synthase n=1 Tax=Methylohalomonas lacus TaxID=398773 RepID=A0AAE3L0T3_9GAMM|nr:malate synthase A [Methylohalomonas lacus]MCS3903069.1 malate synthase [Methylohalomonas lacus]
MNDASHAQKVAGLEILTPAPAAEHERILSPEALAFVEGLVREFRPRVDALLEARHERQARLDAGELPDFLDATADIRNADWQVAPLPADLQDRRVEITGPVDRRMVVNALNSGARLFMADFEDASSPTWQAMIDGQVNLYDAIRRQIDFTADNGKDYRLNDQVATLLVRPRGWHMEEGHVLVDGRPVPAGLWDFGLYLYHNAHALLEHGSGPYFYLPKMQSHLEARLWNDVFNYAQDALAIPRGTIKATVLIETVLAAFEMDEILYELREHSAGLNCGRWDYIFSFIKCFRNHPNVVLPDRSQVTMTTPFMRAYSQLLIKTCHKRGVHAMGGMAAQLPVRDDPDLNEMAMLKVRRDKEREARDGHDGSWVGHPALVPICEDVFNQYMPEDNQISKQRDDVEVSAADLLRLPEGSITIHGLMSNVSAALRYTEAWLGGLGAVPIYNLMEDAATAEIARAQVWQWIQYPKGMLADSRAVNEELFRRVLAHEIESIRIVYGEQFFARRHYQAAAELLDHMITAQELPEFLTLEAYRQLAEIHG